MWKKIFNRKNIYIGLFAALYCITAGISLTHAVAFFGLANNETMSIMLATAFEIGQAAVLFSLLTSKKDRSKILPWVLMFIFTVVQVMGNVFSSYEYLMVNSAEMLKYFKEPIFIWTDLPDAQCNVILAYLLGGLLPICSLALTSMITNFIEDEETEKINNLTQSESETKIIEDNNETLNLITDNEEELKEVIKFDKKNIELPKIEKEILPEKEVPESHSIQNQKAPTEPPTEEPTEIPAETPTEDIREEILEKDEEEEEFGEPNENVEAAFNGEAIPKLKDYSQTTNKGKFLNI